MLGWPGVAVAAKPVCRHALLTVSGVPAVLSMPEHVKKRTREKEEERKVTEQMRAVSCNQKKSSKGNGANEWP